MKRPLRKFLKQKVVWEAYQKQDGFGKATYIPQLISARKEAVQKEVHDGLGKIVVSDDRIFCEDKIAVEDLIDGKRVLRVKNIVNAKGEVVGYEVLT